MKHPLVNRTSPIGSPFLGTCASCGKDNITFEILSIEECPNPLNMTNENALLKAIKGNNNEPLLETAPGLDEAE